MIHIFASFFDPAAKTGKKLSTAAEQKAEGVPVSRRTQEHLTGRRLLLDGLRELYDLFPLSGGKTEAENILEGEMLLETEENGKPFLKEHPDIRFNISHCDGLVVCAFADVPVGVDVETVRPIRDPLVRRVLHEKEQAVLNRYREAAQIRTENGKEVTVFSDPMKERDYDRVFFRYWTLKESFLKRDGCGLTREPRELFFDLDPEDWDSPVFGPEGQTVCRQYRFRKGKTEAGTGEDQIPESEEFLLSVCTAKDTEEEVCFHWEHSSGVSSHREKERK